MINNEVMEFHVMNGVCSDKVSSLVHVWFCDVASPIPSWHRLRRGGVTFPKDLPYLFTVSHSVFLVLVPGLFFRR